MHDPRVETQVLVLRADDEPCPGLPNPGPHQRYRRPRLSIENRKLDALAAGCIRVEMHYVGICGTDLHLVETNPVTGYVRTSAPASIPAEGRVIGHEGVGRVVAVGAGVKHLQPGAMAAFASIIACLHCEPCRRGDFNQCLQATLLGMQHDGLFGTVVDLPAGLAHDVTDLATSEAALRALACLEPAGVALLACEKGGISPGEAVTIFGAGPIGLFCAMICRQVLGASRVVMIEPVQCRRELAEKWCDAAYEPEAYFTRVHDRMDVMIEASGDLGNVGRAFRRIGPNGRVILLARSGEPLVLDEIDHMITQAIRIIGVRGHLGGPLSTVVSLLRSGHLPLEAAVTRVATSLEELLDLVRSPEVIAKEHCKVLARLIP